MPLASNFWILSSALFVTYTLFDASTAIPDGTSSTPAPGYLPQDVSNDANENRKTASLAVSAT